MTALCILCIFVAGALVYALARQMHLEAQAAELRKINAWRFGASS